MCPLTLVLLAGLCLLAEGVGVVRREQRIEYSTTKTTIAHLVVMVPSGFPSLWSSGLASSVSRLLRE